MHYSDILLTIAQISGVLVGFANLAGVFEKPNENIDLRQVSKLRLLIVTEGGIVGIFGCLLPFLIVSFNNNEIIALRISSIILALSVIVIHSFNIIRVRRFTSNSFFRKSQKFNILQISINLPILVTLLLSGIGWFDNNLIVGIYCLAVLTEFLLICMLLIRFLRQIFS